MKFILPAIMIPLVAFSVDVIFTPLENVDFILNLINEAESTIFMVTYSIDHPLVVEALERAWISGIDVKVISETVLANVRFPFQIDAESSLMHMKFMVVDSSKLLIGSSNFTVHSFHGSYNDLLLFTDKSLAQYFERFFIELWNGGILTMAVQHGDLLITNVELEKFVLSEVAKAKKSVKIMLFAFTHPQLWSTLKVLSSRGVKVEIIVDRWFFENSNLSRMPFSSFRFKVFEDFTVHSKLFIIDDRTVITGSANATKSAYTSNAEMMVLIKDEEIVSKYLSYFENVWQGGEDR